jgi:hypothetical protein
VFPEDGGEPTFKAEALRRFANGYSVLEPLKLKDLRVFLMSKGFLEEDEGDEEAEDLRRFLAVRDYLSVPDEQATNRLAKASARYLAQRSGDRRYERIELDFFPDPSGVFFRVEERYERGNAARDEISERKDNYVTLREFRRGYALVATEMNLLYILLKGAARADHMNYFQYESYAETPPMILLRSGAHLFTDLFVRQGSDGPSFHDANIFSFMPNVAAAAGKRSLPVVG